MKTSIGRNYILTDGRAVHCMDTDFMCQMMKAGIPDENGIMFDNFWISWDFVKEEIL